MIEGSRFLAVTLLYKIEFEGKYSNFSLSNEFYREEISSKDRGMLVELVYGVLERKITLDYYISRFSSVPVRKLDPYVLIILRISVYQLVYMNKVPGYSICNEAVNLAKKLAPRQTGFINAILRNMSKEKLSLPSYSKKYFHSHIRFLSVKYSMPEWIIERLSKTHHENFIEKLFSKMNTNANFCIRVNKLKTSIEGLIEPLESKGFHLSKSKLSEYSLIVENPQGIIETQEFLDGLFYIQDTAATLTSEILSPKRGEVVLDACCAPGGKTTHIAELMSNEGEIVACDLYENKLKIVNQNALRLGITIINTMHIDSKKYFPEFDKRFDKVLLDVPCTGLGIMGRKPEIRWERKIEDFEALNSIQLELLENCSKYLKIGGELVYSTCSIDSSENEEIINKFVEDNAEFEFCFDFKYRTYFPHVDNCDGFFISKIRRIK
ncbi:MAG: 16S rRNA (cytosine(967)-C(5))-methyltransferase RsmB [Bacillota bacterium]